MLCPSKTIHSILGALIISFAPHAAAADSLTTHAAVTPMFGGAGVLEGCQVAFDVVRQDPEYSRGEMRHVSGSVAMWAFPQKMPVASLKLGVAPFPTPSDSAYVAPERAYLAAGFTTNAGDAVPGQASDTPGFGIFPFAIKDRTIEMLVDAGATGRFHVLYAMPGGGANAAFDVDLTAGALGLDGKRTPGAGAPKQWSECISALMDQALKSIGAAPRPPRRPSRPK